MKELREKIKEALVSALPITAIVYILALTPLFDLSATELITFTVGAIMLILGIGLFSLGADLAMTPMGTHVGSGLSKQKKLSLLLGVCFVLGMLITIAEPDLQVLANQVSAVMNGTVLVYAVGLGVGSFLVIAILKIIFRRSLVYAVGLGEDEIAAGKCSVKDMRSGEQVTVTAAEAAQQIRQGMSGNGPLILEK